MEIEVFGNPRVSTNPAADGAEAAVRFVSGHGICRRRREKCICVKATICVREVLALVKAAAGDEAVRQQQQWQQDL